MSTSKFGLITTRMGLEMKLPSILSPRLRLYPLIFSSEHLPQLTRKSCDLRTVRKQDFERGQNGILFHSVCLFLMHQRFDK